MFSAATLAHFRSPQNAGEIPDATARAQLENPVCGDILELSAIYDSDRITSIRFRAKGCVASIAAGSALTSLAAGKTLAEAATITRDELLAELGGLPNASTHAAQLALDTLHALLQQLIQHRLQ